MLGRVVAGLDLLQKLERGDPQQGGIVESPERRGRILRARMAADLPESERTPLEILRTDSAAFYALIESRRNRPEEWFVHWADHIDVCAIPVPVR
jgi:peptidylprolyl isomerase